MTTIGDMPTPEWRAANPARMRRYRREWYHRNKEDQKAKTIKRNKTYKTRNYRFVRMVKRLVFADTCQACRVAHHPAQLQFDHVDPTTKTSTISAMCARPATIATIKAEIRKCRLVCANCHAMATATDYFVNYEHYT